jgi:hypothetical protein
MEMEALMECGEDLLRSGRHGMVEHVHLRWDGWDDLVLI